MSLGIRGHRLFIAFLAIILILGSIFLIRPIKAISNQIRAGYLIDQTIDSRSWIPPCESLGVEDESGRDQLFNAIELLNQAIRYEPNDLQSYLQLGKAQCLVGNYIKADDVLQQAAQLRPNNHLAKIERGFALEKVCPPNGECEYGDNSISLWKSAGITAFQFISNGENAYNHQDYNHAISWYIRAQEMGVDLRSTIAYTRFQLCENGDSTCARLTLSEAVQIDTGWINQEIHFLAYYYYGRLMFNEHEWENAEMFLHQSETLYPGGRSLYWALSDIHRFLGLMLANQQKYTEALSQLLEAVNLYTNSYWAHIHLGATLYQTNKNNLLSTQKEFDTGLELAGSNEVAWDYVISYWIQYDQPTLAKQYCDLANQNEVDMSGLKHCLGK